MAGLFGPGFGQGLGAGYLAGKERQLEEKRLKEAREMWESERKESKRRWEIERSDAAAASAAELKRDYIKMLPEIIKSRGNTSVSGASSRASSSGSMEHALSRLKGLGLPTEGLAELAARGGKEATIGFADYITDFVKKRTEAGLPVNKTELEEALGRTVVTVQEGGVPDYEDLLGDLGVDLGPLEREMLDASLYQSPTVEFDVLPSTRMEPLDIQKQEAVRGIVKEDALTALQAMLPAYQERVASAESGSEESAKAQQELLDLQNKITNLKEYGDVSGISDMLADFILPHAKNDARLLETTFGGAWDAAIKSRSFGSVEEAQRAMDEGKIKPGDWIVVAGVAGRA